MARIRTICAYVQDGDTFMTVRGRWIRLANVNTPESGFRGFVKATNIVKRLIEGRVITYEKVGTSYGRIVANVWVGRTNVNNYMRRQGY